MDKVRVAGMTGTGFAAPATDEAGAPHPCHVL